MKNVLFVCSANLQRSLTAHHYFSKKLPETEFQSAGTNLAMCQKEGSTPLTKDLLAWANLVLVMEEKHHHFCEEFIGNQRRDLPIYVLNVPDKYEYYQKELIELLEDKANWFLQHLS